jgi:hypothetical protein
MEVIFQRKALIFKRTISKLNDGIDNNNNGAIDEIGEDCKLE